MNMGVNGMMKRIFALAVAILLALGGAAFAEAEDFQYVVVNDQAYITGYLGTDTSIIIPDELADVPVTNDRGRRVYEREN